MASRKKLKRDAAPIREILDRYKVTSGKGFDLDLFESDDLPVAIADKRAAAAILQQGVGRLAELQELLYAASRWSVLVVVQAMDAGGKDSTIKHVLSGINPQGVRVTSFKAPDVHELAQDFLWRVHSVVPARGMIGVFNRSHYEEVLVTRVHHDLLDAQGLPSELRKSDEIWDERIADIAAFEAYLGRQGTKILKFFLNVGRDEQKARFLARLDEPEKTWKFAPSDLRERTFWGDYRKAYEAAITGTATKAAPWFVVPADRKWFMRLVVAEAIIEALEGLDLKPRQVSKKDKVVLAQARHALETE
jgi:PPK2 family polyphosphate:nucleotide phosphotransferase